MSKDFSNNDFYFLWKYYKETGKPSSPKSVCERREEEERKLEEEEEEGEEEEEEEEYKLKPH